MIVVGEFWDWIGNTMGILRYAPYTLAYDSTTTISLLRFFGVLEIDRFFERE